MLPEDNRGGETPRDLDLELQRRKVHARLFGVALPGLKLGRYTLVRRIGAGGMGVVYAARDDQLEREVALKLLHPQLGGREATTRLLREARAMARLSHPNVVQLYDVGEHAGRVFVTMEFIAGQTLRAWQTQAAREWREIVDMYIQAGKGLAAAHRAGLVHRDFKPENALVGASDGRLRVLDFGLASFVASGFAGDAWGEAVGSTEAGGSRLASGARSQSTGGNSVDGPGAGSRLDSGARSQTTGGNSVDGSGAGSGLDSGARSQESGVVGDVEAKIESGKARSTGGGALPERLTVTGTNLGTPGYAAPEMCGGVPATPHADQYSFCVSLYEALHGRRPGAPPADSGGARGCEVPPWIDAVLARGLASTGQQRWSSMSELLDRLDRDPARARWRVAAFAGTLALIVGLVATVWIERGRGQTQRQALIQVQSDKLRRADLRAQAADAEARREAARAEASRLASLARTRGVDDPVLGLLLASEATMANVRVTGSPLPEAEQVLRDALAGIRSRPLIADGTALVDVALGPRGRRVVTASRDGKLRAWELTPQGESVARELRLESQRGGRVTGLACSSGDLVAASFTDGSLALWNLANQTDKEPKKLASLAPPVWLELAEDGESATGNAPLRDPIFFVGPATKGPWFLARSGRQAVLLKFLPGAPPEVVRLRGHSGRVRGARPSPDGQLVATWARDGVRLWRVMDGTQIRHFKMGKGTRIPGPTTLDIDSNAGQILVATEDGYTRIWPLAGGRPQVLGPSEVTLRLARFTSGGLLAATISEDQRVHSWELDPRGARSLPPAGLDLLATAIGRLEVTKHHDLVVGTPPGGAAYLWSLAEPGAPALLRGHAGTVVKAVFDSRGDVLATASTDGSARLWHWNTQDDVLRGHPLSVTQVDFLDAPGGGTRLLSAGMDGTARVWSPGAQRRAVVLTGHREGTTVIARAHGDGRIVTTAVDGTFARWTREGEAVGIRGRLPGEPTDLALGSGGLQAIGTREGVVDLRRFDPGGQERAKWSLDVQAPVTKVAFAAGGTKLLAACEDGSIAQWDLAGPSPVPGPSFTGHRAAVFDLTVGPDKMSFATASEDTDVRTWSLDHTQEHRVFRGHQGPVWSVAFDHLGKRLVTASSDATARVWQVDAPSEPLQILRGHSSSVWNAAFRPDGTQVVTSSADATARLWTLDSKTVVVLPHGGTAPPGDHHQDVTAAVFNATGTEVATAAADGVVRVFPVSFEPLVADACARAGRALTIEEWSAALGDRPYAPVCP